MEIFRFLALCFQSRLLQICYMWERVDQYTIIDSQNIQFEFINMTLNSCHNWSFIFREVFTIFPFLQADAIWCICRRRILEKKVWQSDMSKSIFIPIFSNLFFSYTCCFMLYAICYIYILCFNLSSRWFKVACCTLVVCGKWLTAN